MKSLKLLILFLIPTFINAQGIVYEKVQKAKTRTAASEYNLVKAAEYNLRASAITSEELLEGVILDLDLEQMNALRSNNSALIQMTFPLPDQSTVTLDLVESRVLMDDFILRKSSSKNVITDYSPGKYYHGIINNDPNSIVSISVFEDEIIGLISNDYGNYVIGKLKNRTDKHIIYNDKDLVEPFEFDCGTEDDDKIYTRDEITFKKNSRDAGDCIRIYIEVDHDIHNDKGGVGPATDYITGLFNEVYTIYANDGIDMATSEILVWDTPSPYSSGSSFGMLSDFQANTGAINGDLGHLVSYQASGGIAAGFDGICNANPDKSKCFSSIHSAYAIVPTYSWSVMVCAHEMGHLIGSRHTHACVWNGNGTAIDGCSPWGTEGFCPVPNPFYPPGGGTIMSYCHFWPGLGGINFNSGFGPQPTAVLLNTIANATCLSPCTPPPDPYVLVATDGDLEFDESIAHSGGIGIMSDDQAEIEDYAEVTAQGTFVQAPEIDVDNTSNVTVQIEMPADPMLPMFRYNNMDGGDDVDVDDGDFAVLTGSVYDDIEVGDDATILFSGEGDVYIDDLKTDDDVTILFDQCTNLMLSGKMKLGKDNNFNPDQMDVTVFAEEKIEIKKRGNIYGILYSEDKFETKKSSSGSTSKLHGMFIGEEIEANEHGEYWFQAFDADCGNPPPMIEHPVVDIPNDSPLPEEVEETELIEEQTTEETETFNDYRLYPNPTGNNIYLAAKTDMSGAATFRITDIRGNLVMEQTYLNLRTPKMNFDVSEFPDGIYILFIQVENSAPVAKKFVVEK